MIASHGRPTPRRVAGLALVLLALVACRPRTSPSDASPSAPAVEAAAPDPDAAARAIVTRWNEGHDRRDAAAIDPLYAGRVQFYGTNLPRAECTKKNAALLAGAPDYRQSLRDLAFTPGEDGKTVLARFTKTVVAMGTTSEFSAYLVLDGALRIIEESDDTTDRNLRAMKARAASSSGTCEGALAAIDAIMAARYPLRSPPMAFPNESDGHVCTEVHVSVSGPGGLGHAPRMYSYCVDLKTGETVATGGWSMPEATDTDVPVVLPTDVKANVARLCKDRHP